MKCNEKHLEAIVDTVKPLDLDYDQALALAKAILALPAWRFSAPITAEMLASDFVPLLPQREVQAAYEHRRSRYLASLVVRERGAHEHPEPPTTAQERTRLLGVLRKVAQKGGWTLRVYTHPTTRRFFYGFFDPTEDVVPAPVYGRRYKDGTPPWWVVDIAQDL